MTFDNDITPERLRAAGLEDPQAALRNLDLLRKALGEKEQGTITASLFSCLSFTADPDLALNNFERFVGALGDVPSFVVLCRNKPALIEYLIVLFGASRFLSAFVISLADDGLAVLSDPHFLAHSDKARLEERLSRKLPVDAGEKEVFRHQRLFRKQEMLRIGLRDLLGKAELRETVEDLSDLAEVCLQKAYLWANDALTKRHGRPVVEQSDGTRTSAGFAVIAMGKLGGRELNFSSDVDLMYVYTADGETEGVPLADGVVTNKITNHQYFVKLAEKMTAVINEKTVDGFVFRVDLRLRPEGQRGPLAQSLGGYEIYYESWGQTWERSALIKARPVAGEERVGAEFLERIAPFVYRKYLDYGAIAEIGDMKQRINKDVEQKGKTYREVKLGYGGIREIEFVIQALQLIYAGRDRSLRERNALKALHLLSQKGLLTYEEQAVLAKAYVFLRTVEHRIQILDDLQTQTIPSGERDLRTLARRTGYFDHGKEAEALLRDYAEHTGNVRKIYNDLFAFTGEEPEAKPSARAFTMLLDPETPESDVVVALDNYGFRDPGKAYRNLLLLREGPAFVHQTPRGRKLFHEIFPPLFHEIITSANPDMALNHLESFLSAQGSWEAFQSLVRLDTSAVEVLIVVFANSEYLSRMLIGRPVLLQNLLESRRSTGGGTLAGYTRELADALKQAPNITEKLDALRRFKHQEEIRIGIADLLSDLQGRAVSRDLSKLAQVCLDAALQLAASEVARRSGPPDSSNGLAIIGVGKLGGRELTYGSDLDILFVYSELRAGLSSSGFSASERFSKVAEKTISYLSTLTREGFAFRIDTRLRPSGSKGPLVQSIEAFRNYYSAHAETWERQALLRARFVAGDPVVGAEFCSTIGELIYRDVERNTLAADIRVMRQRMEEEVGKESRAFYNIKQGAGGLVDIEFLVQYLQLLHGKRYPSLRVPGTYNALRALGKGKLLDREDCTGLLRAYRFLRQLESRMRIVSNEASSELSRNPEKIGFLARRMGYTDETSPAGSKLLCDYVSLSAEVRSRFVKILAPERPIL